VWRIAIAIHAGPRLLVARMYYRYYQGILYQWIHFLAAIACWLNVIENVALIGLTFISSAENHGKCINQNSSITLPWYYRTLDKCTSNNTKICVTEATSTTGHINTMVICMPYIATCSWRCKEGSHFPSSHATIIPPMPHTDILAANISTVGLLVFSSLHCC